MSLTGKTILHYKIVSQLGEGGFAYTLIGDFDEAISLLEEEFETTGLITGPWLEMPFWDELRDYPRFQNLVRRYGR